jgi:hypothetical protein
MPPVFLALAACEVANPAYSGPTSVVSGEDSGAMRDAQPTHPTDGPNGRDVKPDGGLADGPMDTGAAPDRRPPDAPAPDARPSLDAPLAVDPSLVGYWPFEDPVGATTFADLSGQGNVSSLNEPPCDCVSAPGKNGRAVSFSYLRGPQSGIRVAPSPALDMTDLGITISAWINATMSGHYNSIVSRQCGDGDDESVNVSLYDDHIVMLGSCGTELNFRLTASRALRLNQWQHVVATFAPTEVRLYVDNVLFATERPMRGTLAHDRAHPFFIGTNINTNGVEEEFNGRIDDVAIWNRPLTASEVHRLFQGASPLEL